MKQWSKFQLKNVDPLFLPIKELPIKAGDDIFIIQPVFSFCLF